MAFPISVLDLVSMRPQESAASAIVRSLDLARHVEQWGYRRYWAGRASLHRRSGMLGTSMLIGHVPGATQTIRVGSGGVMLPNHAPLAEAEQFGTLAALYPGRIDLGLGRAPVRMRAAVAQPLGSLLAVTAHPFSHHFHAHAEAGRGLLQRHSMLHQFELTAPDYTASVGASDDSPSGLLSRFASQLSFTDLDPMDNLLKPHS